MNSEKRQKLIELMAEIDNFIEAKEEREKGEAREATEPEKAAEDVESHEGWTGPNGDRKKRYTPAFKKMIVGLHRDAGYSFERITAEYGVSKASITKWCGDDRYLRNLDESVTKKELEETKKRCESLVQENEILKWTIQTLATLGVAGGMA